eukprot:238763-Pyramimonas_sp.AAC.1
MCIRDSVWVGQPQEGAGVAGLLAEAGVGERSAQDGLGALQQEGEVLDTGAKVTERGLDFGASYRYVIQKNYLLILLLLLLLPAQG